MEVSYEVYTQFCRFVKCERNLRRSDERHLEQSELTEETLCRRALHKPKPVDEAVNDKIRSEQFDRAIMELPEAQRRRFMLYFDYGLTYEQIGKIEGGFVRPTVGVKLPWCQFATDRLATSHSILGCRGEIEMLPIIKPDARRSKEQSFCLYAPDLKYFLVFGCYIGRTLLPKYKWEVKHYG